MSYHFEHAELPGDLPKGEDASERLAAVLVMVVACLGAFAVYLETRTSNREAVSDRSAKLELIDFASANVGRSGIAGLAGFRRNELEYWNGRGAALAAQAGRYPGTALAAEATAAHAVASALVGDRTVARELKSSSTYGRASIADQQWARAYERVRDQRTSQVTRLIAVITNFAICLFLFALVVTVPPKLRPYFIAVPCIGAALTVGWSIRIWASNVQTPNSAAIEAYVNGNVDFSNGNVQRAIRETSRAITTMTGFEAAYLQRGDAYFYRGDYGKSAADLKTASSLDPQDFSAFNDLAAAYWWLHDYKAAAQAIQRAGRLNPGDPTVVFNEIEGVATTSNDPTAYAGLVKQLESVLRRRGPAAVTDYEGDFDDLAASAADSPAIRVEMQAVCRSLLGLAEPLRIGVENYGCDPLRRPSVSHARFLWRGS